jgi:hypothetical protein
MRNRVFALVAVIVLSGFPIPAQATHRAGAVSDGRGFFDRTAFVDPPSAFRPGFYWWWPGVAVEDGELRAEIREMARAGMGLALIVNNSRSGLPPEGNPPETCKWGTDFMADRYRTALKAGRNRGVRIDFLIGPTWPWASPAVSGKHIERSQQELLHEQQVVVGPSTYEGPPPRPDGLDERHAHFVAVTAAQPEHDLTQVSAERYGVLLDPASAVDLTPKLDRRGQLHWDVPPGEWLLFGFWRQPTGQEVDGGVCDPVSPVDHMRRESAKAALKYLDDHLLDKLGPARADLQTIHEESLELGMDGLLWTPDLIEEFRTRRGYDLTRYLPVLIPTLRNGGLIGGYTAFMFAPCPTDPEPYYHNCRAPRRYDFPGRAGVRVRRDFNETVTDLWVDEHILPTKRWARSRGLEQRWESYGDFDRSGSFDNIAVAKASDVPMTETLYSNTIDFYRTIASGAHLSGGQKVPIELQAVFYRDWMMTLGSLKRAADKSFVGGVNELITHFYPYKRANGAGWPTWCHGSSENGGGTVGVSDCWNGTNPQWPHVRPLADYFARAQTLLSAGRPVMDVAVYRDVYGYPHRPFFLTEEDGDLPERRIDGETGTDGPSRPEPPLNTSLSRAGLNFDFINPATLAERDTGIHGDRLIVEKPGYRALVVDLDSSKRLGAVDNSDAMAAPVARRLVSFARQGLPIVFVGRFPERGVSYRAPKKEDAVVAAAVKELKKSPRVRLVEDETEVPDALAKLGVRPDLSFDEPQDVYSIHRQTHDGDYWFLWNSSSTEPARFVGSFAAGRRAPEAWDLWTGDVTPVGFYRTSGDRVEVPIELAPLESIVIGFEKDPRRHVVTTTAEEVIAADKKLWLRSTKGGTARATLSNGAKKKVSFGKLPEPIEPETWELHVDGAVPEGKETHDLTLTDLRDWREIHELKDTSGIGTYRTTVTLDEDWVSDGRGAYLELGGVEGGVQVKVNGELVYPATSPPPRLDVGPFLRRGKNTIEVELTTTLKNRMNSLATQDGYHRFLFRPEKTQPYGLLGPVQLVPYAQRAITRR